MQTVKLDLESREASTKGKLKALRNEGFIPAVVYGKNKDNLNIKIDETLFYKSLREGLNEASIITMNMAGLPEDSFMIIKDMQRHPVTEEVVHVDFQFVSMDEAISTTVHVELKGNAKGVKQGGIVEHTLREIEIEALPKDIPSVMEIDISDLDVGDSIHVGDLKYENVKILTDTHNLIVKVEMPKVEEESTEEEQDMAEPEVIEKGKKEEE